MKSQSETSRRSIFGHVLTTDKLSRARIQVVHHFEGKMPKQSEEDKPSRRIRCYESILKSDNRCYHYLSGENQGRQPDEMSYDNSSKHVQFKQQVEMHYYYPNSRRD